MAPVMFNCVKRSNALLGYSKELKYGDSIVREDSWSAGLKQLVNGVILYSAVALPWLPQSWVPQPGQGPDRETMEHGSLTLHGIATMTNTDGTVEKKIRTEFKFNKDVAYLYTAVLLVETGMLLKEKAAVVQGGCLSPAAALGSDLTQRILKEMDSSLSIKELE
jgi:short subunit dehydrogenase-like uncharacterized protein